MTPLQVILFRGATTSQVFEKEETFKDLPLFHLFLF